MELHELQPDTSALSNDNVIKMPTSIILILIWYGASILISLYQIVSGLLIGSIDKISIILLFILIIVLKKLYQKATNVVKIVTGFEIIRIIIEMIVLLYFAINKSGFLETYVGEYDESMAGFYESRMFDAFIIAVSLGTVFIRSLIIMYVRDNRIYFQSSDR